MRHLKTAFTSFALIYLISFSVILFMAYTPYWYKASCEIHPRCEKFGMENAHKHIDELAAYLRHSGELESTFWSEKEKRHLAEVRPIYNAMTLLFLLTLIGFVMIIKREERRILLRSSVINLGIVVVLLCLTPWFTPFWKMIHPYFFDNMDWLNTPREVSYWITPRYHFQYSAILLGSILVAAHVLLAGWAWLSTRKPKA